ncbi:MAG: excinuclease ABC subunit UvrC [Oscillospiraceae bacterium]|nr:excinuclease ABC subunit UvrC [Oscillospiraceae bacterium]
MVLEELKQKALSLPLSPGVYLMKDKDDVVIYVGKAKKLKNRVTQYFQDTAGHSFKTRTMVSKIDHFDVIVAASEFEALVLECSLIKRHLPKYNILLKDGKGYPYLRLNMKEEYPTLTMVNKLSEDGATYYGPFGSRSITGEILESIRIALKLPNCGKKFPRDIGKERPCLNYHMGQCDGWCQSKTSHEDYCERIEQVRQLLSGNYKSVSSEIRNQMLAASEALNFELAASLRDRLLAVESLGKKQLVTAGASADMDVIGYSQTESKGCFTVLHFSNGNLIDKEFEIIAVPEDKESAVSSLMKQYYLNRGVAPKVILLPFAVEDSALFSELLNQQFGKKITIKVPQRGENLSLVSLANKNAMEEAARVTERDAHTNAALTKLENMLGTAPIRRIESFDISNLSGTDIVGSMVVFQDGKPRRSAYKRFKLKELDGQDDYASMMQVLRRRFEHLTDGDPGFQPAPDLLLIDGGMNHAKIAVNVVNAHNLAIPVFGMVKDDRHRTRALITENGEEIRIDNFPSVFSFIGTIQEETHRFAISYHRKLRSKRLRYSQLDTIPGIGPKRKQELLRIFKSLTAIRAATLTELEQYLPKDAAYAVYSYYHKNSEE